MKTPSSFTKIFCVLFALGLLIGPKSSLAQIKRVKQPLGWVEKVQITPEGLEIHAKLDPGSDTSSIHADNIEHFKKNGKKWVKFTVGDRNGRSRVLEKRVIRIAKIKHSSGKTIKRATVELGICLGHTLMEDEVTLADRSHLEYEMLIGRSFLAGNVVIDPSLTFTMEPTCTKTQRAE
jgi:hypothetical protein